MSSGTSLRLQSILQDLAGAQLSPETAPLCGFLPILLPSVSKITLPLHELGERESSHCELSKATFLFMDRHQETAGA